MITINSESIDVDDIEKTIVVVKPNDAGYINFFKAIKRVIGWINKPLAN